MFNQYDQWDNSPSGDPAYDLKWKLGAARLCMFGVVILSTVVGVAAFGTWILDKIQPFINQLLSLICK